MSIQKQTHSNEFPSIEQRSFAILNKYAKDIS